MDLIHSNFFNKDYVCIQKLIQEWKDHNYLMWCLDKPAISFEETLPHMNDNPMNTKYYKDNGWLDEE